MGISNLTSSVRGATGNEKITNLGKVETTNLVVTNATLDNLTNLKSVNATITNASIQNLSITIGSANIGKQDSIEGRLNIRGGTTDTGARIRIFSGADFAASFPYYQIEIDENSLKIGPFGNTAMVKFNGQTNEIEFNGAAGVKVTGSSLKLSGGNTYLNLSATTGVNGYGIRDNNGIVEIKHSGGPWTPVYTWVDRGDPADNDFTATKFVTDGNWNPLDLSGILPVGAKSVKFRTTVQDGVAGNKIDFRQRGNSNGFNVSIARVQVPGVDADHDHEVDVNASLMIDYRATNTTWTTIKFVVRKWYT